MTVKHANNYHVSNAVKLLASTAPPEFITPEGLLGYCQSRLRDLDRHIQERFAAEQKTINLQAGLNKLKDAIRLAASDSTIDANELKGLQDQIAALKAGSGDPDVLNRLDAIESLCTNNLTPDLAKDGPIKAIDDLGKDLGSGRELSMIELQSVVSQRQTALQLTTNLMNTMNQSAQGIVQNIK